MAKKKRCIIGIQNKDVLCCAKAIITMKERVDNGSKYQNLRKGKPVQECMAKNLHREADVTEGPCGYQELEKFQDFLGPQGCQLILVEPSECLIFFKQSQFNDAPQVIYLVKHHQHYDGLTSIPALVNCSYYCHHCDKAYHNEDAAHHNCAGRKSESLYPISFAGQRKRMTTFTMLTPSRNSLTPWKTSQK